MKKILAIGIHVDDTEYSVGGTLKLLADKGCDVTVLNITPNMLDSNRTFADKQSIEAAGLVLNKLASMICYVEKHRLQKISTIRKFEK